MFKSVFSFSGRIRRIEYFLSCLFGGIVTGIAFWMGVFAALAGTGSFGLGVFIGFVVLIGGIWFSLAQGVKRLHDLDKSGWLLIIGLIPIVNIAFGLYMIFADGTVGPNRYGNDPKNRQPYQPQPSVNVTVNLKEEKEA